MCVSVHTAPEWCGSCHEYHPADWLGRCPFGTSYIPRHSRVHVVCMPTRSPPVHTTAPTSAYPGHYPRPSLLGRSLVHKRMRLTTCSTRVESACDVTPFLLGVGLSPQGRAVRRIHIGVHTTGGGARGPGTMSFWTQPLSPLWLVSSDDGSV